MIELPIWVLLGLLQIAIILGGLWLYAFIRARGFKRSIAELQEKLKAPPPPPPEASGPDPSAYLSAEADATRVRTDSSTGAAGEGEQTAKPWLALRADLLQLESVFAKQAERDDAFWLSLDERMQELLAAHGLATAGVGEAPESDVSAPDEDLQPVSVDENDELGIKRLISESIESVNGIKEYIDRVVTDSERKAEAMSTLNKLARSHKELMQCVEVLEDENSFLRDQIAALLQDH